MHSLGRRGQLGEQARPDALDQPLDHRHGGAGAGQLGRLVVVAADVDDDDGVPRGEDEPRVAAVLRRAGLAGDARSLKQRRELLRRAAFDDAGQRVEHHVAGVRGERPLGGGDADERDRRAGLPGPRRGDERRRTALAERGDRRVAGGEVERRHLPRAERQRRLRGQMSFKARAVRPLDDRRRADREADAGHRHVEALLERLAHRHRAAELMVVVRGTPLAGGGRHGERRVADDRRGREGADAEGGERDERLEGRSGLAPRVERAVEAAAHAAPPADQRQDLAGARPHDDHRPFERDARRLLRLELGQSVVERAARRGLQFDVHRGEDHRPRLAGTRLPSAGHEFAARRVEHVAGRIERIGERRDAERRRRGRLLLHRRDVPELAHPREDPRRARLRLARVAPRIEASRRGDHPRQHRLLVEREVVHVAAEVVQRAGRHADDGDRAALAEVDLVEIDLEQPLLGDLPLDVGGEERLVRLARQRPLAPHDAVLDHLLGDRAPALHLPAAQVGPGRAQQPDRIDAAVLQEARVLGGHYRLDQAARIGRQRQRSPLGEHRPAEGAEAHRLERERLERTPVRGVERGDAPRVEADAREPFVHRAARADVGAAVDLERRAGAAVLAGIARRARDGAVREGAQFPLQFVGVGGLAGNEDARGGEQLDRQVAGILAQDRRGDLSRVVEDHEAPNEKRGGERAAGEQADGEAAGRAGLAAAPPSGRPLVALARRPLAQRPS